MSSYGVASDLAQKTIDSLQAEVNALREKQGKLTAELDDARRMWKYHQDKHGEAWREVLSTRVELDKFKPQPMSQVCRDGQHGLDCVGCRCLCHWHRAERAAASGLPESSKEHR